MTRFFRRAIAGLVSVALLPLLQLGFTAPAFAATVPVEIDCSAGGLTVGDMFDGITPGDEVVFTVSTGTCAVYLPESVGSLTGANVSGSAPDFTIDDADGGEATLTVALGGGFTIADGSDPAVPRSFFIDACNVLDGSGVSTDPWLVADAEDFGEIGVLVDGSACANDGYYQQTDNLTLTSPSTETVGLDDPFTGTYNGDHYSITLAGGWAEYSESEYVAGLFYDIDGATLSKIDLQGSLFSNLDETWVGGLVHRARGFSVIENTSVSLNMSVSAAAVGAAPLAGILGTGSLIRYSKTDGTLNWDYSAGGDTYVLLGGLVGLVDPDQEWYAAIQDSYSQTEFLWGDEDAIGTSLIAGGLIGVSGADVVILRSYAVPGFTATPLSPTYLGGLVGEDENETQVYASFWSSEVAEDYAFGETSSLSYQGYGEGGAPMAVRLDPAYLKAITTFQSTGDGEGDGVLPTGEDDLPLEESDGDALVKDLRWAIEAGNKEVFIPQTFTDAPNLFSRAFLDTGDTESYQVRGATPGGSVTGYPVLGRVWEICPGDYPVLVWELENCDSGSGGSGGTSDESENPGGLSDEEYAEFLASGLTLEQFLGRRLAATGVDRQFVSLGGLASGLLLAVGLLTIWVIRREQSLRG